MYLAKPLSPLVWPLFPCMLARVHELDYAWVYYVILNSFSFFLPISHLFYLAITLICAGVLFYYLDFFINWFVIFFLSLALLANFFFPLLRYPYPFRFLVLLSISIFWLLPHEVRYPLLRYDYILGCSGTMFSFESYFYLLASERSTCSGFGSLITWFTYYQAEKRERVVHKPTLRNYLHA